MKNKIIIFILSLFTIFFSSCQLQEKDTLLLNSHDKSEEVIDLEGPNKYEDVKELWVQYGDPEKNFRGFLARPIDEGNYPAILMTHEWWGVNQNLKNRARRLAHEGFIVLAVDLYEGEVADNYDDATECSSKVKESMELSIEHLNAAEEFLRSLSSSNGKVASLGWCFGASITIQHGFQSQLDAQVLYYGSLDFDESLLSKINWPVIGFYGGQDFDVPVDSVTKFSNILDKNKVENEIYIYKDEGHGFANPTGPAHSEEVSNDSWGKMVNFLKKHLS